MLFCLVRLGLKPRIATERSNAAETRISKIFNLIQSSRYSIHDLSRCQARNEGEYYRLNMPFELGLDFGCRHYGAGRLKDKMIFMMEEEKYRYQAAISDLAGSDIEAHGGNYLIAIRKVRNWFAGILGFEKIGAARVIGDYEDFRPWYLEHKHNLGFSDDDIRDYPITELLSGMSDWLQLYHKAP